MKEHKGMRPHDIVVLLKIISLHSGWLNKDLSFKLHIAQSEISEWLNRSAIAGLISPDTRKVFKNARLKFLEFRLPFVYPAEYGAIERGLPPRTAPMS
jgi:predicted transcriptional regulator